MSEEYIKLKERLLNRSKWNGECLESTYNGRSQNGYALVKFRKSTIGAHRASWLVHKGEIPEGLWVLHHCNNPLCIRPEHLFLGTPKENSKDMLDKGRHNYWGRKKYDDEVIKKAIELRKDGKTHKEISTILNLSMGTVNSFFRRTSCKELVKDFYNVPKYSEEMRLKALQMRQNGIRNIDIQRELKIPKRSLLRIFEQFRKMKT
jgi:hypothetical protein